MRMPIRMPGRTRGPLALLALGGMLLAAPALATGKKDAQALSQAKMSLSEAIETVTKQGNGVVIEAEFEAVKDGGQYEVDVLGAEKLTEYTLDANSGQVTGTEEKTLGKYLTGMKPEDLRNTRTSLVEAIAIAEQQTGGKAIEAETERRRGDNIQHEVKVTKPDGSTDKVAVNAATGQVAER